MKTIVEEWKKMEEIPNCEISNMGRCRKVWGGQMRYKNMVPSNMRRSRLYSFTVNGIIKYYSPGKLVALYFVPNPMGYKSIRYKDGNITNYCYLNIEWTKGDYYQGNPQKKILSVDKQLEALRMHQSRIIRLIEAIENDKVGEFIHNEIKPIIEKASLDGKIPCNDREEFISHAISDLYDRISRGIPVFNFEYYAKCRRLEFLDQKHKSVKTVEFNEAYALHNTEY
jgi:hypothetical protein